MTDYSKLTDKEINEAVTIAHGYVREESLARDWYYDPSGESHDSDSRWPLRKAMNVCGNWIYAGPILDLILKDRVTVSLNRGGLLTGSLGEGFNIDEVDAWGENTKRVIAICFLMMQEAKG